MSIVVWRYLQNIYIIFHLQVIRRVTNGDAMVGISWQLEDHLIFTTVYKELYFISE